MRKATRTVCLLQEDNSSANVYNRVSQNWNPDLVAPEPVLLNPGHADFSMECVVEKNMHTIYYDTRRVYVFVWCCC